MCTSGCRRSWPHWSVKIVRAGSNKLCFVRWSWNTTPKTSLAGYSPYEVITGLRPRTALASVMEDVNFEEIETKEYVEELHRSLTEIYDKVKKAQEVRAEAAQAHVQRGARELQVGEMVLLRRPPEAVLKAPGLDEETTRGVSRRWCQRQTYRHTW